MTSTKIEVNKLWNGKDSETKYKGCLSISLTTGTGDIMIRIDADYNNDKAPNKPSGRMIGLWEEPYEVFEVFIASGNKEEYVEINVGPHGHYYVKMITKYGTDDNITIDSKVFSMDRKNKTWTAVLTIPAMYLPEPDTNFDSSNPLAIKWYINANAIIGAGTSREYFSAYPLSGSSPNFHQPSMFQPIIMEETEESRQTRLSSVNREKSFFGLNLHEAQSFSLPTGVSFNALNPVDDAFGYGGKENVTIESLLKEAALKLKHDFRLLVNPPLDKIYIKCFMDKEFPILHGLAGKWKGIFSYKKRLLILTSKPRLMYFNPVDHSLKGIIPWTQGQPLKITKRGGPNKFDISIFDNSRTYHWTSLSHGGDSWVMAITYLDDIMNKK